MDFDFIKEIRFDEKGLALAIAQDYKTKEVLMAAYMNEEALRKTLETKKAHYYSRSRQKLWLKGEESGHFQLVKDIFYDCDGDSLLLLVEQIGGACHTGHRSCFYRGVEGAAAAAVFDPEKVYGDKRADSETTDPLKALYATILDRKKNPREGSYTNYLFDKGLDKILKKVGEEAAEVIIAAKNESHAEMTYEIADLMYHVSVLLARFGLKWDDIYQELAGRKK